MALLIALVMSRAIPLFQAMQVKIDRINLVMRETLSGVRVIRAFVRTKHEEAALRRRAAATSWTPALRVNRLFAITLPALMLIMNLSSVAVIWLGAYRVDSGDMPIGNLTAFLQYIMQILFAIMTAVIMFVMVPRAAVSAGRIREVLDTQPSIADPADARSPRSAAAEVEFARRHVRLPGRRGARSCATSRSTPDPGETTAIVGLHGQRQVARSINLLPRFYDVTGGAVLHRRRRRPRAGPPGAVAADRDDPAEGVPVQRHDRVATCATATQTATDEELWHALDIAQGTRVREPTCPSSSSRRSPRAAPTSRAASGSGSRSPARS